MKKLLTIIFFLLIASPGYSEAIIKQEHRVYNETGIQCVYCTLETLAYHNQVDQLYGLTDTYKGKASPRDIKRLLTARGVKFIQGNDMNLAEAACNDGLGCLIGFRHHVVVCVDINEHEVRYIENCDKQLRVWKISRKEFNKIYNGWVCVIWE